MRSATQVRDFLILRLVIAVSGFVLIQLWGASRESAAQAAAGALPHGVIAAYSLEALAAFALLGRVRRLRLFIMIQVAVDLVMEGLLVACTGGAGSVFCPLFFASIFAASTVLSTEGAFVCSSTATIILAVACMLPLMRAGTAGSEYSWRLAAYLFTYGLAFHGASVLCLRIARGAAEAERLTEEIIENMAEGLIATDRAGHIAVLNERARHLLGLETGRRFVGAPIDVLAGKKVREFVADKLRSSAEGRWETVCDGPAGSAFPALVSASALRDGKGRPRGAVALVQDLTLRREVEAASRRIARLEELTEVARGIAHEVRNPLASICGCAEEIAQEPNLAPETLRLCEIMRREARRVDGIIDEFLHFARLRSLSVSRFDAGDLIAHVGELLRARAGRTEIRAERPCARVEITADRDLMTQLLLNLGINALEAIGPAAGMVRLRAAPVPGGGGDPGIEFLVEDNGCGIAKEHQERIFTPFFSQKARGLGIGLAMAHRITLLHGGEIGVDSVPGQGTAFRVWLPAEAAAPEPVRI
ncbi:MAG: PAS domain S-box protein, partial [Planctomycetes bacterium]|nr:PAS domain S-box protein [Planctomycetota bacterium]